VSDTESGQSTTKIILIDKETGVDVVADTTGGGEKKGEEKGEEEGEKEGEEKKKLANCTISLSREALLALVGGALGKKKWLVA